MALHNCPSCGAAHDNGLPEGTWIYTNLFGGMPVVVSKGDSIARDATGVWLTMENGEVVLLERALGS